MRRSSSPRLRQVSLGLLSVGLALALVGTAAPAEASPADPALAKKLGSVLNDSRVRAGDVGVAVMDAGDGRLLYGRSSGATLIPASNTKLLTAAAALHELGPSYRFKTEVYRRAALSGGAVRGHLYLKGFGDPSSRESDYRSLAQQVRRSGVRTVTGDLVVDAGYFDSARYNPGWSADYADDYYAGQITGLTLAPDADLESGTVWVKVAPARTKGGKPRITTVPAGAKAGIRFDNDMTTRARGTANSFSAGRKNGSATIRLTGRLAVGASTRWAQVAVDRPDRVAAAVFRAELAKAGVTVRGRTVSGGTPRDGRVRLARDTSVPLSALLVPFLKLSVNQVAEALTKAMAVKATGRPGSWSAGLARTRGYLRSLGVPAGEVSLSDGSGLTRRNRVSARAMAATLRKVRREPWFGVFHAALPVAGNTLRLTGGTLRYRMNGTRAANNARAKTGTLNRVTALSGYVRDRDGRLYTFAMISNYRGSTPRPVENELVVALAGWRG